MQTCLFHDHAELSILVPLECKLHHTRIQSNRQQEMTDANRRHGQNRDEVLDLPAVWDEAAASQNDHHDNAEEGSAHAELERLEHLGHFLEEVGRFGFFGGCAPGHVDFEHVSQSVEERNHVSKM